MKQLILIIFISALNLSLNSQTLESDTILAGQYMNEGKKLYVEYKLDEAFTMFGKARSIYSSRNLNELLLKCDLNRAGILIVKNEMNDALSILNSGLSSIKRSKGENNALYVDYSDKKGLMYLYTGDYYEAQKIWIQTLIIAKKVYGSEHVRVSDIDNNIGVLFSVRGEYFKALKLHQTALEIREKNLPADDLKIAVSLMNVGNMYAQIENTDLALEYYLRSLTIKQQKLKSNDFDMASLYYHLGTVYHIQGDNYKSVSYFEKSLNIRKKFLGDEHPMTAEVYAKLAEIYNYKGKYEKASDYGLKAFSIFEEKLGKEHPNIPKVLKEISTAYLNTDEFDKAKEYSTMAIKTCIEIYGSEKKEVAQIYIELGDMYYKKFNDHTQMNFYEKAMQIQEKIYLGEHPDIADTYQKIGTVYKEHEEYYDALKYYNKCLDMRHTIFGNKHPQTALIYLLIAEVYDAKKEFGSEQKFLQKSLVSNIKEFNSENSRVLPDPDKNLKQVYDRDLLLKTLTVKAEAFKKIYFRTNKIEDLDEAYKVYEIADAVLDRIRQFAATQKEKRDIEKNMSRIYDEAVNVCMLLYKKTNKFKYFEKAFQFSEKYKAGKIAHVLPYIDLEEYTGVNDSVLHYEKLLTADIFYYKKRSDNEPTNVEITDKLFKLESKHDEFISELKEHYEDYYLLKYKAYNASVNDIRKVISDSSMMISYFTADLSEFLYVFTLSKDKGYMYFMKKEEAYNSGISKFKQFLKSDASGNVMNFKSQAYELYKMLIPEGLSSDTSVKELIIIPDDKLTDLPFEVLFTEQYSGGDNYSDFPYLIKKIDMSYFYTANLFYENFYADKTVSSHYDIDTTLFPDYYLRDNLSVLDASDTEINNHKKGEGVLGLTLSMISWESKNIIASLWKVSDNTENYMIDYFEDYMIDFEENEHFGRELRNAKLQLIRDGKYAHPSKWSPYVLIGN